MNTLIIIALFLVVIILAAFTVQIIASIAFLFIMMDETFGWSERFKNWWNKP